MSCRRSPGSIATPRDALAWVPPYARGVAELDLDRLRRAPVLDRWLRDRGVSDCAARLSARVRKVVAVSLDGGAETLGFVLAGALSPAEVVACARQASREATPRALNYRGFALTRITLGDPRGGAEIHLIGESVALVGPPWVARSLLDAGISHAQGHSEPSALRGQWDALPPDAALRAAWRLSGESRDSLGVEALRVSASVASNLSVTLTAVTPSEERAVAVAHRALTWRDATAPSLQSEALRAVLSGLRLRAEGRAVSASLTLDPSRLDALTTTLGALATGL